MENLKNSALVNAAIKAIYDVASRRSTSRFAEESIGSTIKTLEGKYDFLKYIRINRNDSSAEGFVINISPDINSVHPSEIGKAIESIIRVIYNDLNEEAGLYFVTELKQYVGEQTTSRIIDCDVDLDQIQLEQHYAYRRQKRKKAISESVKRGGTDSKQHENLLGYIWSNVSSWKHEPDSKFCTLYNKEGKVLDRLNIDRIIQNYVEKLSGHEDMEPSEIEKETRIYEKEYDLLKLMLEKDMDAEMAARLLHISEQELKKMISKLSQIEMLQYVSYDTLELTNTCIGYLSEREKQKN